MTAPFLTSAYIFLVLSRLHAHFLPTTPLVNMGHLFLPILPFFNILPSLLQAFGLLLVHGYFRDSHYRTITTGTSLLFASFILHLVPLLVFFACLISFTKKANRAVGTGYIQLLRGGSSYKGLTTALFWVIGALLLRTTFYAYNAGTASNWTPAVDSYKWGFKYYEPFFLGFDAVPMLAVFESLAWAHPGRFLRSSDARPREKGTWSAWRQWRGARAGEGYRLDAERGMQDDVRQSRGTFVA